jgi:3-deoxy-D-manno-octulosonic-acid transferase
VYTAVQLLALPAVLVRLVLRARRNRAYVRDLGQRFGLHAPRFARAPVWVHAVSVGEAQAAVPLVREVLRRHPQLPLLMTTTTPTGRDRVRAAFGDAVVHRYLPYDLPPLVSLFLDRVRPGLLVVMETELWPNLFAACAARDVPILLANLRLSDRSARGYRAVGALTREMLGRVTAIAAQSEEDAARVLALGAPVDAVEVTGSVKFDLHVAASLREEAQVLRRRFGTDRSVFIAASTHDGEDAQILDAYAAVLEQLPRCLLVLVPRHPERFTAAAALCRRRGFATALRSRSQTAFDTVDVFVGDSMGELPLFYAASDVAFVGGSLVPTGGHNLLEPAALGLPVLFGPYVFNFAEISRLLLEAGAAWQVADARGLAEHALALLKDANLRHNAGDRGRQLVERHRGARDRLMTLIEHCLDESQA